MTEYPTVASMPDLIIRDGRVIDPANHVDGIRHVVVRDGKIFEVAERIEPAAGAEVVDAKGKWVLPGLIDLHVHLREPGEEYKETIETGTRAAAAGGFTAVVSMPNTKPPNDSLSISEFILRRAREVALTRVYPTGAITKGLKGEELTEIGDLVGTGCVAVSDDGRPVMNAGLMRRALEYARNFGVPVIAHEEELTLVGRGVMNEGPVSTRLGLMGVPAEAETVMVARDILLAELTGARLHIAHASSARTVELVREAKRRGVPVTAEAAPHHFSLTDSAVSGYDPDTKMNPPLRSEADRAALIDGMADGTIDAVATDHAPHSSVEKLVEYDAAANGVIGLETALPLLLELIRRKKLSPSRAAELVTAGPARTLKLPGGTLSVGSPADIALVDPDFQWTVEPGRLHSKSRNTPFKGSQMTGRAVRTYLGGRLVHQFLGEGCSCRS
jgi:dihydroorotase